MFALVESGSITKTLNGNKGIKIGDIKYPATIYSLWTEAERNAIGVYTVEIDETNRKDEQYYINTDITYAYHVNTCLQPRYANMTHIHITCTPIAHLLTPTPPLHTYLRSTPPFAHILTPTPPFAHILTPTPPFAHLLTPTPPSHRQTGIIR